MQQFENKRIENAMKRLAIIMSVLVQPLSRQDMVGYKPDGAYIAGELSKNATMEVPVLEF
ncbi:hypothetical protein [Pontibacter sp. HSC-36F09]|uniref:hypothetical protein n=1 Tax=Pontibacter sp. HSC-36F09 TaxID=2910966 RepID=UPI00209D2781|nr:hypothetical protein [Pontibacter sp. HSC-36F09]MCP2045510.1 hypothetical protein [Pontibacter sp. HSC-36F09]